VYQDCLAGDRYGPWRAVRLSCRPIAAIAGAAPSIPEGKEKLPGPVTNTRLPADVGGTFTDIAVFDDGDSA
jgi:hypothetical protein